MTRMKVLIVEDDDDARLALTLQLRRSDHEVLVAADGDRALHLAQSERPDVIVLDLGLPSADGYEVMRRLRASGSQTPVIVLSARDPFSSRDPALDAGAVAFLQKPADCEEVLAQIERQRPDPAAPQPPAEAPPPAEPETGRRTLLIVDDDDDLRLGLGIRMRASGYEVLSAADAPRALELAQEHRPDAVLLDLGLPGGGGFGFAQRCREQPELSRMPIIVLTGSDRADNLARAQELGIKAFFQKPIENEKLLGALAEIGPRDEVGVGS